MTTNTKRRASGISFHNGHPTSALGREVIRSEIHANWDGFDPWGSALLNLGGLGDAMGEIEHADYPGAMFLEDFQAERVSYGDLQYWAKVMDRLADLVPEDDRY